MGNITKLTANKLPRKEEYKNITEHQRSGKFFSLNNQNAPLPLPSVVMINYRSFIGRREEYMSFINFYGS